MAIINSLQKNRELTKMQILLDRKVTADLLWDIAYQKALSGNIDRNELYRAAKFCNDVEKAILNEQAQVDNMRLRKKKEDFSEMD